MNSGQPGNSAFQRGEGNNHSFNDLGPRQEQVQGSAWCPSQGLPTASWPQPSSELPTSAPAA